MLRTLLTRARRAARRHRGPTRHSVDQPLPSHDGRTRHVQDIHWGDREDCPICTPDRTPR